MPRFLLLLGLLVLLTWAGALLCAMKTLCMDRADRIWNRENKPKNALLKLGRDTVLNFGVILNRRSWSGMDLILTCFYEM